MIPGEVNARIPKVLIVDEITIYYVKEDVLARNTVLLSSTGLCSVF